MNTKKNIIKNLNLLQKKFLIKNSQDYILANESINIIKGHPTFFEIFEKYSICKYLKLIVKYSLRNLYILLNSLIYYKPQFQKKKNFRLFVGFSFYFTKKKKSK